MPAWAGGIWAWDEAGFLRASSGGQLFMCLFVWVWGGASVLEAQVEYSGVASIFIRALLYKQYTLPLKVRGCTSVGGGDMSSLTRHPTGWRLLLWFVLCR
jgi:hypothetical protein